MGQFTKDGKMAKSYHDRTCDIEARLYELIENNVKLEQSTDSKAYSKVSYNKLSLPDTTR